MTKGQTTIDSQLAVDVVARAVLPADPSREQIAAALAAVVELRRLVDELEAAAVAKAVTPRGDGWWARPLFTWAEVALHLGRSKSAVHRQYGNPPPR